MYLAYSTSTVYISSFISSNSFYLSLSLYTVLNRWESNPLPLVLYTLVSVLFWAGLLVGIESSPPLYCTFGLNNRRESNHLHSSTVYLDVCFGLNYWWESNHLPPCTVPVGWTTGGNRIISTLVLYTLMSVLGWTTGGNRTISCLVLYTLVSVLGWTTGGNRIISSFFLSLFASLSVWKVITFPSSCLNQQKVYYFFFKEKIVKNLKQDSGAYWDLYSSHQLDKNDLIYPVTLSL